MAHDRRRERALLKWTRAMFTPFRALAALAARFLARLAPAPRPLEPPGVPARRVFLVLGGWAVFVALSLGGLGWYTLSAVPLRSSAQDVHAAPAPRLQVDGKVDLDRLFQVQLRRLETRGWADRDQDLVSIPIDRAKALVAARGAGAFAPLSGAVPDEARARAVSAASQAEGDARR